MSVVIAASMSAVMSGLMSVGMSAFMSAVYQYDLVQMTMTAHASFTNSAGMRETPV